MKVFVTGANGQLGQDVVSALCARNHEVTGSDRPQADITDAEKISDVICGLRPDAIIHCAAWTNVDAAEDEDNRDLVWRINAEGTRNVAAAARNVDAKMIYISTDYVFDGSGQRPWEADCQTFAPLNIYGSSKLQGERYVLEMLEKFFVVRTAWLFGAGGDNFIDAMLRVGKGKSHVNVVDDQVGTPTYTTDLSQLLADMTESERYGFYHATNAETTPGGYISRADMTEEIYRAAGYTTQVNRITTAEYGMSKAVRPLNSRLDKSKLLSNGFRPLPAWNDAVHRYICSPGNSSF
ncbi:MAG: dTDP-4-dehydrorhamnose reductase [Bacillota bacterium]|nr:dTDP-4-dehydrorhamnose reductase [Bacillota bacterium]